MLARNILLFTILLDSAGKKANPKLWNIFHDFYIQSEALDLVRDQSAKLVRLSYNIDSWNNGPYGHILHILNTETLRKINTIWTKYANASDAKGEVHKQFRDAIEKIVREHYTASDKPESQSIPSLTRSFGLPGLNSIRTTNLLMQQFWSTGVADRKDIPKDPICNPLFVFSSAAGDKFVVNYKTTPLAIFHFAHIAQQFGESRAIIQDYAAEVLNSAKKQFEDWCNAFVMSTKRTDCSRIIIRFVVADPIALSFGLQQRMSSNLPKMFINHSALWSGTELVFDAIDMGKRQMPIAFNVIDTSTLCDHVGVINALVATIPLLQQSPASTIQMESTSRPWSEETLLLRQFLDSDTTLMCNILGVAPLPYLTGITTRGLLQDVPTLFDFSGERPGPGLRRVIWKVPSSGDSRVTEQMKLTFHPDDFVNLLMSIYEEMFINTQQHGSPPGTTKPHHYTRASFAALLAFLKPRISVNWDQIISLFIEELQRPPRSAKALCADLEAQLHFFGVFTTTVFTPSTFRLHDVWDSFPSTGVLSLKNPPATTIAVLSVPRRLLQPIYQKCVIKMAEVQCDFVIRLHDDYVSHHVYSSPVPVFGSLKMDSDGQSCQIETDEAGWNGSSDVHFCLCLKTRALLNSSPGCKFFSLNLWGSARKLFRNEYGKDVEIFRADLFDESKLRLVNSISGHPTQVVTPLYSEHPATSSTNDGSSTDSCHDETITPDGKVSMSSPRLSVKVRTAIFTRRITLLTEFYRQTLAANSTVSVKQTSPCTVTVNYGSVHHLCQFPYPVKGQESTVRVARKSGWIEVSVPLIVPTKPDGGYTNGPIPLVCGIDSQPCSWNLPTINFNRLPRIDLTNPNNLQWLDAHLIHIISDQDGEELDDPPLHLETKIMFSAFIRSFVGLAGPKGADNRNFSRR